MRRLRQSPHITLALFACGWLTGCQMTPAPGLINCPLPSTEQVQEILQLAPLGTPRQEAIERLKKAGVLGTFGENQSIYYCDVWDKGEGLRWHINVALLFDDSGTLYATRPDRNGQIDPTPRAHQTPPGQATSPDPADLFQ